MAAKEERPYSINANEFGEKVYRKYLEAINNDQRDEIILDMVNFSICITLKQDKATFVYLGNIYQKCLDLYGNTSADGVDSLIEEFVTNSLHGKFPLLCDHDTVFEKIRNSIFPLVRQKKLVDDYDKISYSAESPDSTITFFPFRSLPCIGVSLAIIEGPLIRSINRGMIKNWRLEPKVRTTFTAYGDKEEQLNLILDLDDKDFLHEEISLLQMAKENLTKVVKKKFKNGVDMWHRYPSNAFRDELGRQEYSNISGSLLLLPRLISESRLRLKGDTIAVAAEESTLYIGGAQEPLSLCFIGDMAIELGKERYFITADPLRLVKHGNGLWKWENYVPNLEKKEFSVPNNKAQVDMIFKSLTMAKTNKNVSRSVIPVFGNLHTPLTMESQQTLEQDLELEKLGKPHCVHIPLCWCCGTFDRKLKQCEGCFLAQYCERKCQKAHWKLHKAFCKSRSAGKSKNENNGDLEKVH